MTKKRQKPKPRLTIYYQNVNGLNGKDKQEEFRKNIMKNNYDVICLTETMFKEGFIDSVIFDDRYVVFHYYRDLMPTKNNPKPKKRGGGVLIAVKKELNPKKTILPIVSEFGKAEQVCVGITLADGQQKNICCAYIPGYSGIQVSSHLRSLRENPTLLDNIIIVGDYNMPNVNFNAENASEDLRIERRTPFRDMARFFLDWGLTQFNHIINRNNVTLDLVLSYLNLEVISANPLVRIDVHHPAILINLIEDEVSVWETIKNKIREPIGSRILKLILRYGEDYLEKKMKKRMVESAQMFTEKEIERKRQEENDEEKARRESERKKEEERKKQEERDKKKAKRERERRNNNNYKNGDNMKEVADFVGTLAGVTVVAIGVGILITCPALIPTLPATGKTAVASAVVVKTTVGFAAVAIGALWTML